MDMKPWASHSPWYYLFNNLSCSEKDQGMTKLHISQGSHVNGTMAHFPRKSNYRHLDTYSKNPILS